MQELMLNPYNTGATHDDDIYTYFAYIIDDDVRDAKPHIGHKKLVV